MKPFMNPQKRLMLAEKIMGHTLYPYQNKYLLAGNDPSIKLRLTNKSRQTGITTIAALEAAIDIVAFDAYRTYQILIVSKKQEDSIKVLDRIKQFISKMIAPNDLDMILEKNSSTEIQLKNNHSSIVALSAEPSNARGYTADLVILDEFAWFERQEELYEAVSPATIRKGRISILSTPNGRFNLFYKLWMDRDKKYVWSIEIPWHHCPDLTEDKVAPEKERLKRLGRSFKQEYECDFATTVESLWTWDKLQAIETSTPMTRGGFRVLGWDPARQKDSSGVCILQIEDNIKEVIHLEDISDRDWPQQVDYIRQLSLNYKVNKIVIDSWGVGDVLESYLRPIKHMVTGIKYRKNDKIMVANYILAEAEHSRFWIRQSSLSTRLMEEIFAFDVKTGEFPKRDNYGKHYDLSTALFLSWSQVSHKQPTSSYRDITHQLHWGIGG